MKSLFVLSFLVMALTISNCVSSKKEKEEYNLREKTELLPREKVLAMIELEDNSKDLIGPNRQELEEKDEKFRERLTNLTPMSEMFEDILIRKKMLAEKKEEQEAVIDLPIDVDLRDYASSIKEQWNGTCSAFGLIAAEEVAHCKQRGECGLDLSERHFWSFYKKYSAPIALEMSSNFVALDKYWPQSQVDKPSSIDSYANYRVSESEYLGGDTEKAKKKVLEALAQGRPVYMWSQTPSCMLTCKKTCNSSNSSFEDGGHAYAVVGYFNKENPTLIIKNSWGSDCGDNGYQYMSFKIWDNATYWEAASIIQTENKGVPSIPDAPKYVTKCEYRWAWSHFWTKKKYCWEEEV